MERNRTARGAPRGAIPVSSGVRGDADGHWLEPLRRCTPRGRGARRLSGLARKFFDVTGRGCDARPDWAVRCGGRGDPKYPANPGRSGRADVEVGRSSPYRIAVSEDQRRELERRGASYSQPWRDVVRAKAVLLAARGLSNAEISERLDVSVSEWRFFEEGVPGLEERPRPGRPRAFSPGIGRRGQGTGLRAAGRAGRPALALVER